MRYLAMIAALVLAPSTAEAKLKDFGPKPSLEDAKGSAEVNIKAGLRDPDSAQFIWRPWIPRDDASDVKLGKNGWFICGQANAKNAYGGYVGYRQFIAYLAVKDDGKTYATYKFSISPEWTFGECAKPSLESPSA